MIKFLSLTAMWLTTFIPINISLKQKDMATVLKSDKREFEENQKRIDNFRLFTDVSRVKNGIDPRNLNFDLRLLIRDNFQRPTIRTEMLKNYLWWYPVL